MAKPLHRYTFAEYLEVEEFSELKHEFLDGEIYAMAGGTPEHAALGAALSMLGEQLRGTPSRVYSSDLRVRIPQTGLATYPDVTVVCGPIERDPESPTHVVNPHLLVEVLSEATEAYDRGEKLEHYRRAASVRAVVLVSQRERRIEVCTRESGWSTATYTSGQVAALDEPQCVIDVDSLYDQAGV